MADPTGTLNARPGDSNNLLLRKILLNLADLPGTFLTPAEGDLRYLKLTGGTLTGVANTNLNTTLSTPWFAGPMLTGANTTNTAYQIDSYGAQARYDVRRAGGTQAAPSALQSGNVIGGLGARGHNGTAYSSTTGSFLFTANGNWSGTNLGTIATVAVVPLNQTAQVTAATFGDNSLLSLGNNVTFPAWTVNGAVLNSIARTYTNGTSTGTVAAIALHSLAASTLAATNATTFTDAANLYIAGDVAAGTNVTLTNSYGLWNVGKTRLDGAVSFNGTAADSNIAAYLAGSVNGATGKYGFTDERVAGSGVTSAFVGFGTGLATAAASFTVAAIRHFSAAQGTFGAGSTVTLQTGFNVSSNMVGAATNYAFRGQLAADGVKNYNLYMGGTAPNYLAGVTGVGVAASATAALAVAASVAGVASLRVPHGTAPSSPVDGDIWTTTAGLFVRVNGSTVGPLS